MVEDEAVKETDLFVGEITDDFGYRWIFVKPRATELKEHFTLSTMYQGRPVYGWVRKFPNWEDRKKEVESYARNHEARTDVEAIHTIWSIRTLISKYGPVATIRELKKRCDAGAIVGCSMYLNFSLHLIETALKFKDPAMQVPSLDFLEAAEGDRLINRIKEIHAKYPDRKVPKNVIGDLQDEFRDELERRVGRIIPRLPGDATREDIMQSKKIAEQLSRGMFIKKPVEKPRPPPAVAPTPPVPVEKLPETKPGLELFEKEIKERIEEEKKRRARGGKIAGESGGSYQGAGEKKGQTVWRVIDEATQEILYDGFDKVKADEIYKTELKKGRKVKQSSYSWEKIGEPADRYTDDRTKIKFLEDLLVRHFNIRHGRSPNTEEMQAIRQRIESLIRKYGTYTYNGLENAINASLSIEDLENMLLAIHASNLTFDEKKKLSDKIAERRKIFKGEVVGEAGDAFMEPQVTQETEDKVMFISDMTDYITAVDREKRKRAFDKLQASRFYKEWFDKFFHVKDRQQAKDYLMKFFIANEQGLDLLNYTFFGVITEYFRAITVPGTMQAREVSGSEEEIFNRYTAGYSLPSLRAVTYLSDIKLAEDLESAIPGLSREAALKMAPKVRALAAARVKELESMELKGAPAPGIPLIDFWGEVKDLTISDIEVTLTPITTRPYKSVRQDTYAVLSSGRRLKIDSHLYKGPDASQALKQGPEFFRKEELEHIGKPLHGRIDERILHSLNYYEEYISQKPGRIQTRFGDYVREDQEYQTLTTLPGGIAGWGKTQELVVRLKKMGIKVDVEPQYFEYRPKEFGDAPELITHSIIRVPAEQYDKASFFLADFMKQAGFELKEDSLSDRELDMVAEKISKLSREERVRIARAIIVTMGPDERKEEVVESIYKKIVEIEREKGVVQQISLDDIAKLPKEKRLALARKIAAGETEIIREVQDVYSGWTFDDFRTIINRTTSIEDLSDLAKHISESRATTPKERVELRELASQREREIRSGGPELKKQIEEQQREIMAARVERVREDEVREDADEPVEPRDYTQWTYSDFENFIPGLESIDELQEMYEYVGASDKVTEKEGDVLRDMINKRIEKLRGS